MIGNSFIENFNGTELNIKLWQKTTWENGVPNNVTVKSGLLKCLVDAPKTSANIASVDMYGYGNYTIRMKFPGSDQNLRGAFWLRNGDLGEEIDIEYYRYMPNSIDLTIYNNNDIEIVTKRISFNYNLSNDFHIWRIRWLPGVVAWYLDGRQIFKFVNIKVPTYPMIIRIKADNPSWRPDNINPGYTLVDYIRYSKF